MNTKKRTKSTRNQAGAIPTKVVTYCRVSTDKQGVKGLGMETQRQQIAEFVELHGIEVIGAFEEAQTGKGADALEVRPQFAAALALAEQHGATLLVAKLDRLSRDWGFLGTLYASAELFCLDVPDNNKRMIQLKAFIADWEGEMISERTVANMATAKAKGIKCGAAAWTDESGMKARRDAMNAARESEAKVRAEVLRADLVRMKGEGLSLRAMAGELALAGHVTDSGKPLTPTQVSRLLQRLDLVEPLAA